MAPPKFLRLSTFLIAALIAASPLSLTCAHGADLPTCDADDGGLKLPPGFCALMVADELGAARHMA
jgi:hypothetical protein